METLLEEWDVEPPKGRMTLEGDGLKAARHLAELLTAKIDEVQEAA